MSKNYEKIYKKLIKEIKIMIKDERNSNPNNLASDAVMLEVVKKESSYAVTCLTCILEMNEEIEGKKCNRIIMNKEEFKKWKKVINVK